MLKQEIFNNEKDTFLPIEVKKQIVAFYPKEESQMFQTLNSENTDKPAFDYSTNGVLLNSSHTATDYIGAATKTVPCNILEEYANFNLTDLDSGTTRNLFADSDIASKLSLVNTGVQLLRIPRNVFGYEVEDENGVFVFNKKFGKWLISITPKFLNTNIINIVEKEHVPYEDISSNNAGDDTPVSKRRDIIFVDLTDFQNTIWEFENESEGGVLYDSIVEVWDGSNTRLKSIKVISEAFISNSEAKLVLYPNNFGFDSSTNEYSIGDNLRIYPKETYFDKVLIDVDFKDENKKIENLVAFMLNDVVRDMLTGTFDIYDDQGFQIDQDGNFTGKVIKRYQISATDRHELRRNINTITKINE